MSTISNITTTSNRAANQNSTSALNSQLGKDAFLKLLTAQLKYQDPLAPKDNQDFIGQMAQFSSLEQMTNLAQANTQNMFYSQMGQGVQMIGKQVSYNSVGRDGSTSIIKGTCSGVVVQDGKILLKVDDKLVNVTDVTEVKA